VVQVGTTVRRPTGAWTAAVHALLRHLESVGYQYAPRVLGIDDQGREILTYIPGEAIGWFTWPDVMRSEEGPVRLAEALRAYHDAVRTFEPPQGAVWRNPLAPDKGELVRHGDFAPFNTIWRSGQIVGVIDWDFAQPGSAISDLAYLAWYAVPLREDRHATMHGFTGLLDRSSRLEALCRAYRVYGQLAVVDEAIRIIEVERVQTRELALRGLDPWMGFAARGNLEAFDAERDWIVANRQSLGPSRADGS